jgi:hypothetical protein
MRPGIDFDHIRGHGRLGRREDGFEELVSQLMVDGLVAWPEGTVFARFGNPDGGREGRGMLPSGDVWAWQTKYLTEFDNAAIGQLDDSIARAIQNEPRLRRYYIAMPFDLPAGDTQGSDAGRGRLSAHTKWLNWVDKWTTKVASDRAAACDDRPLEVIYIGRSEMSGVLTQERQVGRLRYWFDLAAFSDDWFRVQTQRAVADAGPRYTPELNVELPIAGVFDGVGRTPEFADQLRCLLAALRKPRRWSWRPPEEYSLAFEPLIAAASSRMDEVDHLWRQAIGVATSARPLPDVTPLIGDALSALQDLHAELSRKCRTDDGYYLNDAATLYSNLQQAESGLYEMRRFASSNPWRAACSRLVVLTGKWGSGKTHLLCDNAIQRGAKDAPTLLLLGQYFDARDPLVQLGEMLGFTDDPNELLDTMQAAAEARDTIAIIALDALNESFDRDMWLSRLAGLSAAILARSRLALVVSCRDEYLDVTIPQIVLESAVRVVHRGFADNPQAAIRRYLDNYGIEYPSFPLLDPEWSNPLFLKLLCRVIKYRGERRFPREGANMLWVYDGYLDQVEHTLAARNRCDYDWRQGLVRLAVNRIAAAMRAQREPLARDTVRELVEDQLPGRQWSASLMKGMIDEGVLVESRSADQDVVVFGYERLGDLTVALLIADQSSDEFRADCEALAENWWINAGLLQALAVVLPEKHGVELMDVISQDAAGQHSWRAGNAFLESLQWRSPSSINGRAVDYFAALLDDSNYSELAMTILVRVATLPSHPLNSEWLHRRLSGLSLHERDQKWTPLCNEHGEDRGVLFQLADWAWSPPGRDAETATKLLAALPIAWCLCSSNRFLRDFATKALVYMLEPSPSIAADLVERFRTVDDDPYVHERLLSVCCGLTLRTSENTTKHLLADAVSRLVHGNFPLHLLSRNYIRRTLQAAIDGGWQPPPELQIDPPYGSPWPIPARSANEIKALSGPPDYAYSSIGHSVLDDFGDFHKYVIQSAIYHFDVDEDTTAELAGRVIFDRVLDLGWTPEAFRGMDRRRSGDRARAATERIGKKYQWIAFYETLGRLADNVQVGGQYSDDPRRPYQWPNDLGQYDIDPTVTVRPYEWSPYGDTPVLWTAPVAATYDSPTRSEWLQTADGLPDPLALIPPVDAHGVRWLTLEGHYQWTEPISPELQHSDKPYCRVWYQVRSYLYAAVAEQEIRAWAQSTEWHGRWMPESASPTGLLLADFPHHPTWQPYVDGREGFGRRDEPPVHLGVTTTQYYGSEEGYEDAPNRVRGMLPSGRLYDLLELRRVADLSFQGPDGTVVLEDFSATMPGPFAAHVRADRMRWALAHHGIGLMFTVLGEKQVITDRHDRDDDEPVMAQLTATYLLDEHGIELVASSAEVVHRGHRSNESCPWPLTSNLAF